MSQRPRRFLILLGFLAALFSACLSGRLPVSAQPLRPDYLIIAPDLFMEELAPLAALQQSRGFEVRIAPLSETGTAKEQIKAFIQGLNPLPKYVLLVGDTSLIPAWDADQAFIKPALTDYDYSTLNGDRYPDVILGRVPVHTETELAAYTSKLTAFYDRTSDPAWLDQVSFISTDAPTYRAPLETAFQSILDQYTIPYGYKGSFTGSSGLVVTAGGDRLYPETYGAAKEDVLAAINTGRAVITFIGGGSQVQWEWQSGAFLTASDVQAFIGPPVPLVIGLNRGTESSGTRMVDAWLSHPSSGALTYIGGVGGPEYKWNTQLTESFFFAEYNPWSTVPSVGEAFQAAMLYLDAYFKPGANPYYELYQLYGDPSLTLRKPRGLQLSMPLSQFVAPWGYWMTLPISVKNVGPTTETFAFKLEEKYTYPFNFSQEEITLPAGGVTTVYLSIFHDTAIPLGYTSDFTVTANQVSFPDIKTELSFTTRTYKPAIFFPLIQR